MQDVVLRPDHDSLMGWLFSLATELRSPTGTGRNVHSARAAFERALASRSQASAPAVWRLYLQFSLRRLPAAHTKALVYRAMRACPWAKALFLFPFRHLRGEMSDQELRAVYATLGEKELRLHVDLSEVLEGMD